MPAAYQDDQHTGKNIFGYVADGCSDDNFWCRNSQGHVDISTPYLRSEGLLTPSWNGRKITWDWMAAPPNGCVTTAWLRSLGMFIAALMCSGHRSASIFLQCASACRAIKTQCRKVLAHHVT